MSKIILIAGIAMSALVGNASALMGAQQDHCCVSMFTELVMGEARVVPAAFNPPSGRWVLPEDACAAGQLSVDSSCAEAKADGADYLVCLMREQAGENIACEKPVREHQCCGSSTPTSMDYSCTTTTEVCASWMKEKPVARKLKIKNWDSKWGLGLPCRKCDDDKKAAPKNKLCGCNCVGANGLACFAHFACTEAEYQKEISNCAVGTHPLPLAPGPVMPTGS